MAVWLSPTSGLEFNVAVVTTSVTVATTPTLLYTSVGSSQVQLLNTSATADVFIGNSLVSTSNGFKIAASGSLTNVNLDHNESLYGVVSAATGTVAVFAVRKG